MKLGAAELVLFNPFYTSVSRNVRQLVQSRLEDDPRKEHSYHGIMLMFGSKNTSKSGP